MLNEIITVYGIIDDLLKAIGDNEDCRRNMSDAEIITTSVCAVRVIYKIPRAISSVMPKKKYIVSLTPEERAYLEKFTTIDKSSAYKINHARILLLADTNYEQGGWIDQAIASTLNISGSTIERIRQRFVEEGLEQALNRQPQSQRKPHRLDGEQEADYATKITIVHNKIEFCYTPKHGSWLNMAEIEFSVLARECLDRRIPDQATLKTEIAAWEKRRNNFSRTVDWQFTTVDARIKLKRLYPSMVQLLVKQTYFTVSVVLIFQMDELQISSMSQK